ncbi:hypothetical protein VTO42DRAFT_8580 [Malbranchea cinnamomea]
MESMEKWWKRKRRSEKKKSCAWDMQLSTHDDNRIWIQSCHPGSKARESGFILFSNSSPFTHDDSWLDSRLILLVSGFFENELGAQQIAVSHH